MAKEFSWKACSSSTQQQPPPVNNTHTMQKLSQKPPRTKCNNNNNNNNDNDNNNNNNNNNNLPPSLNEDRCATLLRLVVFWSFLDLIQSANQNLPNWIITMQPQNVTMCIVSFPSSLLCLNMKSPNPKKLCQIFMDVRNFEDLAPLVKE